MEQLLIREMSGYHGNCNKQRCSNQARWKIVATHRPKVLEYGGKGMLTTHSFSCWDHIEWFTEEFVQQAKRRILAQVQAK